MILGTVYSDTSQTKTRVMLFFLFEMHESKHSRRDQLTPISIRGNLHCVNLERHFMFGAAVQLFIQAMPIKCGLF